MQGIRPITAKLRAIRRRLATRLILRSTYVASGLTCLFYATTLMTPLGDLENLAYIALLVFALAFLVSAAIQFSSFPGIQNLAQRADVKFSLSERLSSALEVAHSGEAGQLQQLQLQDAAGHADQVDAVSMVSLRPNRLDLTLLALPAAIPFPRKDPALRRDDDTSHRDLLMGDRIPGHGERFIHIGFPGLHGSSPFRFPRSKNAGRCRHF